MFILIINSTGARWLVMWLALRESYVGDSALFLESRSLSAATINLHLFALGVSLTKPQMAVVRDVYHC
jgi:hypothetical protein